MAPWTVVLIVLVVMGIAEIVLSNLLVNNMHPLAGFKAIGIGLGVLILVAAIAIAVGTRDPGTSVHPAILAAVGLIVCAGLGYGLHLYLKLRE